MRIAILGICHETNTFSNVLTDYAQFEESGIDRGEDIVRRYGDSNFHIAGYLEAARDLGFQAVPLTFAQTGPIGIITRDAYDRLTDEMFGQLRDQDVAGVSSRTTVRPCPRRHPDMDGAFAAADGATSWPELPVGICLDMHSNVSARVVAATDVFSCGARTRIWTHANEAARPRSSSTEPRSGRSGPVRPSPPRPSS